MPKYAVTFKLVTQQQLVLEAEEGKLPFDAHGPNLHLIAEGKTVLVLPASAFVRCELIPEESKVVKP